MKNFFLLLFFGISSLTASYCQSKNKISTIESSYYTDSIYSNNLSEYRKHNIYLPQNFDATQKYPIVYATDGSTINSYHTLKQTLDSLINNHIIRPIIFIKSFNNPKIADSTSVTTGDGAKVYLQFRNFEYVNSYTNIDSSLANRFKNHMSYFKDELIPKIETEFNQKLDKKDRFFYGFSNGAGFGISLLNLYPNTIGTYLCFSTVGGDDETIVWKEGVDYPDLYIQYGIYEGSYLKTGAEFLQSKFDELNQFIDVKEFNGGHDSDFWNAALTETLTKLFSVK